MLVLSSVLSLAAGAGVAREFIKRHLGGAVRIEPSPSSSVNDGRLEHLSEAYKRVPENLRNSEALRMEFGVREGVSINHLAGLDTSGHMWDGFDSFVGLPRTSGAVSHGYWRAGAYTTHGRLPATRHNVRLHAGWFNDTLPAFLDGVGRGQPVAFLHLDADIFESTWAVLEAVCARCLLRVGSVLSFDELFAKKQTKLLEHEWRALRLAARTFGFRFRFITWMLHPGSAYARVGVQVTSIEDGTRCTAASVASAHVAPMRVLPTLPGHAAVNVPDVGPALNVQHAPCAVARKVYLDLGVNWCNTLELHRRLPAQWLPSAGPLAAAPWHVYGFEASPLIAPYAESCMHALTDGRPLPTPPLPPTGSGPDLLKVAARYNCTAGAEGLRAGPEKQRRRRKEYACVFAALRGKLDAMQPNSSLTANPALLRQRLARAAACPSAGDGRGRAGAAMARDEYSLLPAAAGSHDGSMLIYGSREDLIVGGVKSSSKFGKSWHRGRHVAAETVSTVGVAAWLARSFKPADFVVLKMDVEGAEHQIVPAMLALNATQLVDVLLWECHYVASTSVKCHTLEDMLRGGGVKVVFREPYDFDALPTRKRIARSTPAGYQP